jgi:hypothetical protein
MTLPYTFGTQSGSIPLNELDENFQYLEELVPPLASSAVTVTASAQPNVTSLGTLATLSCTGTITSGTITAGLINGTLQTPSQTNITSLGTLSSLTVSGSLNGTLSTAAQPNITSVGTLSSLGVSGNISGNNLASSGTANIANLVVTGAGTVGTTFSVTGNITGGNVIATNFVGSGTQLTGINGPAFIATITTGQGLTTSPATVTEQTLIFDTVSKNIDNGYSAGIFTAPVAGFYQVSGACAVTPTSWASVLSYYGTAVLGIYKNNVPVAAGPFVDMRGAIISGVLIQVISASSVSSLIYLDAGDNLRCKLAYITNAPTNFWNTYANVIPNYFQACWLRS